MVYRAHGTFPFECHQASIAGLDEITGVGYNLWTSRKPHELGGHAHPDHWEIHYLVHGQILEEVAGQAHVMTGGDVFIAPPGVVHTGINRVRHRCGLCWMGVRLPLRGSLPGLGAAATRVIRDGFKRQGGMVFPGDPFLLPAFSGLLQESARSGPAQLVTCRAYLHLILALLTRPAAADSVTARKLSPAVAAAARLLATDLGSQLRLGSLLAQVGLRRSALNRRFLAEIGLTPVAYRLQLRLEEAKRLLPAHSNAEIAGRLGFASPQHFATMFKRAFTLTPGASRQRLTPG